MTLSKGPGGRGSHDAAPERADLPGLREKALSPQQKKALVLLEKLYELRQMNKEQKKRMKDAEQDILEDALEALDDLEMQAWKIGPATFEATIVRKLKLAVGKHRTGRAQPPATGEGE